MIWAIIAALVALVGVGAGLSLRKSKPRVPCGSVQSAHHPHYSQPKHRRKVSISADEVTRAHAPIRWRGQR